MVIPVLARKSNGFLQTNFSVSGLHILYSEGDTASPEAIPRPGAAHHPQGDDVQGAGVVHGAARVRREDAGITGLY